MLHHLKLQTSMQTQVYPSLYDFSVHGDCVLVGVGPLASSCGGCLDSKGRVIGWAVEDDGGGGDGVDDGVGGLLKTMNNLFMI
jgi:hypothetical protein